MRPNPVSTSLQVPIPLTLIKETRHMPFTMPRFLDVAASIIIVVLASFTAGATVLLGA